MSEIPGNMNVVVFLYVSLVFVGRQGLTCIIIDLGGTTFSTKG